MRIMMILKTAVKSIFTLFFFFQVISVFPQARSISQVFPSCTREQRDAAFSSGGYLYYGNRSENLTLLPRTSETITISKSSLGPKPGFFLEYLQILPRKNVSLLRVYNAVQKIQDLKGRLYFSHTAKRYMPVFTDAVRIEGPGKLKVFLPDPPLAGIISSAETIYARVTDIRFGNCYFEISLTSNRQGILYRITNFRTLTYGPIPVVKERVLNILLYIEPVEEGLAVYCLAGAEVSDFIAKYVDIPTALDKRMSVFVEWLLDGTK
jgi:hypothetical protein